MQLPNPETLLSEISTKIKAQLQTDSALVGIHRGGVWIMERIISSLDCELPSGTLDAALYRDDFAQRGLKHEPKPSQIPFDVQGKHIILIDDILYTGRTARAAMNELFDYGRPASITLVVLINRGGAELPIAPQIVGASLALKPNQYLQLTQDAGSKFHLSLENNAKPHNV